MRLIEKDGIIQFKQAVDVVKNMNEGTSFVHKYRVIYLILYESLYICFVFL